MTYILHNRKYRSIKWIYGILLGIAFFQYYVQADYLKSKVTYQYEKAQVSQNRFGAGLLDLNDLRKRPLFGWSRHAEVLFQEENIYAAHRPNGITNLLRTYGIVYSFIYFSLLYISFKKLGNFSLFKNPSSFAIFFMLVILTSAFSQLIFDNMFFRSIIFMGDITILNYRKETIIKIFFKNRRKPSIE
jgi:hypothetical protein